MLKLNFKTMKKYLKFMAFAMMAVFSLAFVSCGDDDDEPNKGGDTGINEQFSFTINVKTITMDIRTLGPAWI